MAEKINKLSTKYRKESSTVRRDRELPNLADKPIDSTNKDDAGITTPASHNVEIDQSLRESVKQIIKTNTSLLQPLVSQIVNGILSSPEVFDPLVDAVANALAKKMTDQILPEVKQDISDSISMDISTTQNEIKELRDKINTLHTQNEKFGKQLDDQDQYSRRNCLLLHGVPETPREYNTTPITVSSINNHMKGKVNINAAHIDRSHRLGRPKISEDGKPKPRPIIIKFVSYTQREAIYRAKKHLKGTKLLITESLTPTRMSIYREAQQMVKSGTISNVWSQDGRIVILDNKDKKVNITKLSDLDKL